jgi:hypothetical protein
MAGLLNSWGESLAPHSFSVGWRFLVAKRQAPRAKLTWCRARGAWPLECYLLTVMPAEPAEGASLAASPRKQAIT